MADAKDEKSKPLMNRDSDATEKRKAGRNATVKAEEPQSDRASADTRWSGWVAIAVAIIGGIFGLGLGYSGGKDYATSHIDDLKVTLERSIRQNDKQGVEITNLNVALAEAKTKFDSAKNQLAVQEQQLKSTETSVRHLTAQIRKTAGERDQLRLALDAANIDKKLCDFENTQSDNAYEACRTSLVEAETIFSRYKVVLNAFDFMQADIATLVETLQSNNPENPLPVRQQVVEKLARITSFKTKLENIDTYFNAEITDLYDELQRGTEMDTATMLRRLQDILSLLPQRGIRLKLQLEDIANEQRRWSGKGN